ncbi:HrgA protein [Pseudomonas fluorescens]|uniref:COG2958 family protein n=1 Tax=Pseudomonas fluorescens TaxID=294 RepID=UPI00054BBB10|nr:HrgA protein [Pseudomonas fluorescens]KII32620.1 HrgA protein [Pseudomonas fluorescens]
MALNLRQRVIERLQSLPDTQQTARELAQWIFEQFPAECAVKKAGSASYMQTDADLVQQLVAEISGSRPRWQQKHLQLKTTEGRPRRYYWSEMDASAEVAAAEGITEPTTHQAERSVVREHALYPLLAQYLLTDEQRVYAMRIDEKRSSNRLGSGGNDWLHPDLVGMEDLTAGWTRELRDCVGVQGERRARLWSFEAKLLLNRSNARKSFFQAVSNSSWANFGYLVAATVEGDGTLKELRMLAAAHGIGVIQLDVQSPTESQILIPARERSEIDWDMCNRLTEENGDFAEFIGRIRRFHQTGELSAREWEASA